MKAITLGIASFGILLLSALSVPLQLRAQTPIADAIKKNSNNLSYPASVKRFYKEEGFRLVWVLQDTIKTPAWNAMLLIDCSLQYGLTPADYHARELSYEYLHTLQTGKVSDAQKAQFDVLLSDAVITLINNLHYGKLNPDFPHSRIDSENITEFKADHVLIEALYEKDMMAAVLKVQPESEAYINLQRYMKLLTTKYSGSNYVKPEKEIRKVAINMERLRWINTTGKQIPLTCIVREGVLKEFKDKDDQDIDLGKGLYNEDQVLNKKLKINNLTTDQLQK